jgi:hypothetical protein
MSRVKELHDEIEGLRLQNENLKARKKDYFAFQCPACGEVTRGIVLHDVIFSSRTQPKFILCLLIVAMFCMAENKQGTGRNE